MSFGFYRVKPPTPAERTLDLSRSFKCKHPCQPTKSNELLASRGSAWIYVARAKRNEGREGEGNAAARENSDEISVYPGSRSQFWIVLWPTPMN
jgi:hypothetical protein